MPTEIILNDTPTTLASDCSNADTVVHLVSTIGPGAGPSQQFRITIDSEIMIVTSGFGTPNLTVTRGAEGTAAVFHAAGTAVHIRLTAGALANFAINPGSTQNLKNLNAIRFADQFTGASVAAQIQAANDDLAGASGLVVIPSSMGAGFASSPGANTEFLDLRAGFGLSKGSGAVVQLPADVASRALDSTVLHNNATAESKSGTLTVPLLDKGGAVYNVKAFGALGDQLSATDGGITAASPIFTSASAAFVAADIGKVITVMGSGAAGIPLNTTILSRQSSTQITLNTNAVTTVAAATYYYGTDNTAPITAALAAIPIGGTLFFPPGTYRASQFSPNSNTILSGAGAASIIDLIDDRTGTMQTCFLNGISNIVIQDLLIRSSNATARTGVYGVIRVTGCTNVKILRCMVTSSPATGIFVALSTNVLIEGNTVSNTFADGIHTQRANKSLRIIGNYVLNSQDDGIATVSYTDQANCEDVVIVGNTVAGTQVRGRGIAVVGGRNITVQANAISNTWDAGILCAVDTSAPSHYPFHVTIAGNTVKHAGFGGGGSQQGVSMSGCRGITVADNIIDDSAAQGIALISFGKDVSILNNVITRSGGRSIESISAANSVALGLTELFTNLGDTAPASWGVSELRISGNRCRKTSSAAFTGEPIYIDGTAIAVTGLVVTDNDLFPNGANFNSSIKLTGIQQGVVTGNRCQPYNGRGVELYASSGLTVANNTVAGMSAGVALFSGTVECLISGNIANDAVGQGLYCDATSNNNLFTGNESRRSAAPVLDQGTGNVFRSNAGYNPFGVVTVAVPATTVAVAAVNYDRTFYVTSAAGGVTMAIQGGPSIVIPASSFGTVRVPAGQTVTPTYTNAPTWVVEGE